MGDKRLIDGQFIVTLLAMGCIEAALLSGRIDGNTFSVLFAGVVAGFLALTRQKVGS